MSWGRSGLLEQTGGPRSLPHSTMKHIIEREPMPAPRPRARAIRLKGGNTIITMYNPKEYMQWKAALANALRLIAPATSPLTTPLRLYAEFVCTRPKTSKLSAPKPDVDNYAKGLMDALTDAGWWEDDTQVQHLAVLKRWAPAGTPGFIQFTTEEI